MKTKVVTLTAVFSSFFLTFFSQKGTLYIRYPRVLGIAQTCIKQQVDIHVEITTETSQKIKVHSFALDTGNFAVYKNEKKISETDTLLLSKKSPVKLTVRCEIGINKATAFTFKTDQDKYKNNQIQLVYGQYFISEEKEQFINVTESCRDSIKVFFPGGGTMTTASLYNSIQKKTLKSVSYHFGEGGNYMSFSKADVGRYNVQIVSCHWRDEFNLTIK